MSRERVVLFRAGKSRLYVSLLILIFGFVAAIWNISLFIYRHSSYSVTVEEVKGGGKRPSCSRIGYLFTLTSEFFSDGYLVPVVVMGGGEGWKENK